jgi:membrane protease YdiL (CAAX protease family)
MKKNNTSLIIIGLLITLGFSALPISKWEDEFASVWHLIGYEAIWWTIVMLVLVYVRLIERRPLASIGLISMGVKDIFIGILTGIIIVVGLGVIYYGLFPALSLNEDNQVNQLIATPFLWRFFSVIRAAVGEEILFRGYAIERLQEITGSKFAAAVFSCTIFTLEHVGPWGWSHLLLAGFGGIILTVLYLWRRNLWVNIVAHFIVDGASFLA